MKLVAKLAVPAVLAVFLALAVIFWNLHLASERLVCEDSGIFNEKEEVLTRYSQLAQSNEMLSADAEESKNIHEASEDNLSTVEKSEAKNALERMEREREYYLKVSSNPTLLEYVKMGKYTRDTPEIRDQADRLYNNSNISFSGYEYSGYVSTGDPIEDYIRKSLLWVYVSISTPFIIDFDLARNQKDASWVLKNKKGYCDEKSILFTSLMRVKGIPSKIVIKELNGRRTYDKVYGNYVAHAEVLVWLDGNWVVADPSHNYFGKGYATGKEITSLNPRWQNW
jgi:hypothetical protein